jgi:hypothetical protein
MKIREHQKDWNWKAHISFQTELMTLICWAKT